jgi:hypothetical protein
MVQRNHPIEHPVAQRWGNWLVALTVVGCLGWSGTASASPDLDLDPATIESSPTLQRWLESSPNVLEEIRNDPSFRTRLRLGYSQFPSTDQSAGFAVALEDVFVGRTGLTVSGDYHQNGSGNRRGYGADLRYYLLPLGGYGNVAPVLGYRHVETQDETYTGVNVGLRLQLVPSRTGAADVSLTQTWVSPGSGEEVGITTLSAGYAFTDRLRLSTDLQRQQSPVGQDSRVGVSLDLMF